MPRPIASEPPWVSALRTRPTTRLVRAWGLGGVRLSASGELSLHWRDATTFVTAQLASDTTCVVQEVDVEAGTVERRRHEIEGPVAWGRLCSSARWVTSGPEALEVRDAVDGRLLARGPRRERREREMSLIEASRDGRWLLFGFGSIGRGHWPAQLAVVDVERGTSVTLGTERVHQLSMAFTEDAGEVLAFYEWLGKRPRGLLRYDRATGAVLGEAEAPGRVHSIVPAGPGRARVLVGTKTWDDARAWVDRRGLYEWDLASGRLEQIFLASTDRPLEAAAEAGGVAVEVGDIGPVRWRERGALVGERLLDGMRPNAWISPDANTVVLRDGEESSELMCVSRDGREASGFSGELRGGVRCVALRDDGRWLAVGGRWSARVLDVASGETVWLLESFLGDHPALCFRPGGRELYAMAYKALVRWDLTTGLESGRIAVPEAETLWVRDVLRCSPDGNRLAYCTYRHEDRSRWIVVVDLERWGSFDASFAEGSEFEFAPDGDLLVMERDREGDSTSVHRIARDGRRTTVSRPGSWGVTFSCDATPLMSLASAEADGGTDADPVLALVDAATLETRAVFETVPVRSIPRVGPRYLTWWDAASQRVVRVDVATGAVADTIDLSGAMSPVKHCLVTPDDRRVVVMLDSAAVLVFDDSDPVPDARPEP